MTRHRIITGDLIPNSIDGLEVAKFNLYTYSKFKYGSVVDTRKLSILLIEKTRSYTEFISQSRRISSTYYISSTVSADTPSASHWLARNYSYEMNRFAYRQNMHSFKYIDLIQRNSLSLFADYGMLSFQERRHAQLKMLRPLLLTPKLKADDTLVIVNDIYVTGEQFRAQKQLLEEELVISDIVWLYLCRVESTDSKSIVPGLENHINNFAFPDDKSFLNFLRRNQVIGSLYPTKRLLLKILTLDHELRLIAISYLDKSLRLRLFNHAICEGLHLHDNLREGVIDLEPK